MKILRTLSIAIFGLLVMNAQLPKAQAGTRIGFVGAANFANYANEITGTSTTVDTLASTGLGGGLILDFAFGKAAIEISALYEIRKHNLLVFDYESTHLNLPVVFRLYPVRWFSIGAGGFFTKNLGNVTITGLQSGEGTTKGTDFGAVGAIGFTIPFGSSVGFILDAKYYYGMTDQAFFSDSSSKWRMLSTYVGLKFGDLGK